MNTVCLMGPTACGKSAAALAIAEKIGAEIVSGMPADFLKL